ncbi:MAG: hypothetical protein MJE66_12865, partial [Proteobacteria bacterium]|nr:hypothetical protein [Pseudomonadota bacterium]
MRSWISNARGRRHQSLLPLVLLTSTLFSVPAAADMPALVLDSTSFFLFPGVQEVATLPGGATIPIAFKRQGGSDWTISIQVGDFALPPIEQPNGA